MKKRKKRPEGGLVEITELLEGALQTLGVKGDFEKSRLEKKCRELLGPEFSRALTGVEMKGRVIRLEFNHSIWLNEMTFRKVDFLQKLQRELPAMGVKSLELSLSRKSATR
jgi:hypothetical protein